MFRPVVALVLSVGVALAAPGLGRALASDCLVFGRAFDEQDVSGRLLSENIMLALNTVGICVTASPLPGKRIQQALMQGEIDGEFVRVRSYAKGVGDIAVFVEEPVVEGVGFIVARDAAVKSPEDLGSKPLGTLRGYVWQEEVVPDSTRIALANSYEQLAQMFVNGRVAAILIDEYNLERFPELEPWPRTAIARLDAYIVLHKSKAVFREPISQALRFYKSTGCVFEKYHGGPACGLRNPPNPNNQ